MQLRTVVPHPAIAPYIHHFWVFESAGGLPATDLRVVVPNGRHKLIVPYRNGLTARGPGVQQHHAQGEMVLIGLWEEPTEISSTPEPTCSIGIEFLPHGLSRFVEFDLQTLTRGIVPVADVLDRAGRELSARIASTDTLDEAIAQLQLFLLSRLRREPAPHVDAVLRLFAEHDYQLEINELERRMGYSRRYLHALMMRHVGLPPKRLQSVLAFERLYRSFSRDKSASQLRSDALTLFFDQSHFIRTFRRYTGFAPGKFAELDNEFGRIFYRPAPQFPSVQYGQGPAR
ncbi:MAG TPA: AraC family transcriptional regulator [Polyangiales bacterium]